MWAIDKMWFLSQAETSEELQAMVGIERHLHRSPLPGKQDWGVEPGSNLDSKRPPNSGELGYDIFAFKPKPLISEGWEKEFRFILCHTQGWPLLDEEKSVKHSPWHFNLFF